jgi:hypothetical protein
MPLPHAVWKKLTYRSWDVQSHPIDLAEGPQGWGPFDGPYTPKDYLDPVAFMGMSGISVGYNVEALTVDHGPGYHDITIFPDRSTESVNNALVKAINNETVGSSPSTSYTSTISNSMARVRETTGGASKVGDLLTRLKTAVAGA